MTRNISKRICISAENTRLENGKIYTLIEDDSDGMLAFVNSKGDRISNWWAKCRFLTEEETILFSELQNKEFISNLLFSNDDELASLGKKLLKHG